MKIIDQKLNDILVLQLDCHYDNRGFFMEIYSQAAISLIGLTTMAGAVGAGGIGSFAINYGQNLHHQDIVNVCVVLLLVCVSLIQIVGNTLAKETTNKALFTHKTK